MCSFPKFGPTLLEEISEEVQDAIDYNGNKVLVLRDQGPTICPYPSFDELRLESLDKIGAKFKGCFEKDGSMGSIKIRTFTMTIRSLSSSLELKQKFGFDQWKGILSYMSNRMDKSFIDKLLSQFQKKLVAFRVESLSLTKYEGMPLKQDYFFNRQSKSKMLRLTEQEKYLLELE